LRPLAKYISIESTSKSVFLIFLLWDEEFSESCLFRGHRFCFHKWLYVCPVYSAPFLYKNAKKCYCAFRSCLDHIYLHAQFWPFICALHSRPYTYSFDLMYLQVDLIYFNLDLIYHIPAMYLKARLSSIMAGHTQALSRHMNVCILVIILLSDVLLHYWYKM